MAAAVFMALLATASTVPLLALWWCLYQAAQNAMFAALTAIVPDRVPSERRGTVSAVYAVGISLALAAGATIGARFLTRPGTGFAALAVVPFLLPAVAVLLAPDYSSKDRERSALTRPELLAAFTR
jgi:MFS family permease